MTDPDWAPLTVTFSGISEIDPQLGRGERRRAVQLLDVREPDEFIGPLGHIEGAVLIPLGKLAGARWASLSKDKPIVAICRSGARSAQAVNFLQQAGFHSGSPIFPAA